MTMFLYHYTNLEALACILKNRTIRFSNLSKMDDLQEAHAEDVRNVGQIIYVSSWTDDEEESIPMWNMYASLESGVRIKLQSMPFKHIPITADEFYMNFGSVFNNEDNNSNKIFDSVIPLSDFVNKKVFSLDAINRSLLYQVQYTSDQKKLMPKIRSNAENTISLATGKIGKYKNIKWEFQHEWRYRLMLFPVDYQKGLKSIEQDLTIMVNQLAEGIDIRTLPYFDVGIDDSVFEQMEITYSPEISEGNKVILEALVQQYNKNAVIKKSSLSGLI